MLPDGFIGDIVIGVALEVLHEKVIQYRESPDWAFTDRPVGIDLVDAPVVRTAAPLDAFGRCVAGPALTSSIDARRIRCIRIVNRTSIDTEVHIMLSRKISG